MQKLITPLQGDFGFNMETLMRDLDRTKSIAFTNKNGAFLGSLLCSLEFQWVDSISTAATDGIRLMWNPHWFQKMPLMSRQTVLMHELWHVARLHFVRMGSRNPRLWNIATDIKINNDLIREGYSFEDIENCFKDLKYPPGMSEEDIYDDITKNRQEPTGGSWSDNTDDQDLVEPEPNKLITTINNVVRAKEQAKIAGGAGSIPGDIELTIKRFMSPIISWDVILNEFMQDLVQDSYSLRQRNRRFPNVYMPGPHEEEGALSDLAYYEDVSGSTTDQDGVRFNSEMKYVKEIFQPKMMTLIQFDTRITQVLEYRQEDSFEQVKIIGRGGTDLEPVRQDIIKRRPTAAIIFSDMQCKPMRPISFEIPVIWIAVRNRDITVPFGKLIHIR